MQTRNVFAGPYLERASHMRTDLAWFDGALADAASRVVPVWNSRNLIAGADAPRALLLGVEEIPAASRNSAELILLGRYGGAHLFAYEITGAEPPAAPDGARFEDLRLAAALMPDEEAGVLSYARAMIGWRRTHRYCGACGSRTLPDRGGHRSHGVEGFAKPSRWREKAPIPQ